MPRETAKTRIQPGFLRSRGDDRSLSELARRQHGVVGRTQLLAEGWSEEEIEWRLSVGRLHRLHAGAYALGHAVVSREGRWTAAVLASGPSAVLSHWSAAALWMIRPNSRSIVDVTTPHKSRSWDGIKRHHKTLPADEVTVEEGIPVTTVPRTIFDLAAAEPVEAVENMLREAEYRRHYDQLSLWDLVERYRGRRGVRRVRVALGRLRDEPSGRKRSRLEERLAPFLRHHRLPLPRFNDWISVRGKNFQVDCHWPGTGQVVELDGWDGHGTRTAFREDRARDRILRVTGYSVTRITWNQLDDEPEQVAADLRVLLFKPARP